MAKITWLGEDRLHENEAGPSATVWAGFRFPKGEAVEVIDMALVAKAKGNQFFKVEGAPGRPKTVKPDDNQDQG